MSNNRNNSRNENDDAAIGKADAQAIMQRGLEQGMRDFEKANENPNEGTEKLFGLFPMDAGFVRGVNGIYGVVSGELARILSPKVYTLALNRGPKILGAGVSKETLHRTAAGAALAANLGMFMGAEAIKFTNDVIGQHRARADIARQLAPVLDDIKGKHSVNAYNSISVADNSVIWAHRNRMAKEANALNTSTVMSVLANNVVNFYHQKDNVRALATGKHLDTVFREKHQKQFDELTKGMTEDWEHREMVRASRERSDRSQPLAEPVLDEAAKRSIEEKATLQLHREHDGQGVHIASMGITLSLPTMLSRMTKSSLHRLQKTRQPYSAWEMIHCLSEQLQNNPGGDGSFQLPGQRGRELPLEKYVAEIFKQHQREMCDLDSHYSELRQSLHEDLGELVKPIAAALRSGKLNPLMLVRLAGESKVIKNQGRGLASATDVQTTLESYAGKSHRMNTVDPKEYLSERNFSLEHVKDALHSLQGEERLNFAAAFPDGVNKAAGLSEKEIQAVQTHRAQEGFKHQAMNAIVGENEKSDEELKNGGLGSAQITQLREATQLLMRDGVQAFESLLGSPTNANGIENVLTDLVVPKLAVGDGTYLGKLVTKGQEVLKNSQATPDAETHGDEMDEARAGEMAEAAVARAKSGTRGHNKHGQEEKGHHEEKGRHTSHVKKHREQRHESAERD